MSAVVIGRSVCTVATCRDDDDELRVRHIQPVDRSLHI